MLSYYGSSWGVRQPVTFDLSGSKLSEDIFQDCLRLVQTYVSILGIPLSQFLLFTTLDAVRRAIASAGKFFVSPAYNVWKDLCDPGMHFL